MAIGAAVAVEGVATGLSRLVVRVGLGSDRAASRVGTIVGLVVLAFAVTLGGLNFAAADRSDDHSGDDFVATVLHALPPNAAILSYWDASTPLWHGKYVLGLRPDVLVVDDTNIVYDGWGTREARVASLICERPVFVLRLDPRDLQTLSTDYTLSRFLTVRVAIGGPSAATTRDVYRVEPKDPATCPG